MLEDQGVELSVDELQNMLADANHQIEYYRQRAAEAGRRNIREIDQLLINMAERKLVEKRLNYFLNLDRLINDISSRFLRLSVDELEDGIIWTLEHIGIFYGVDRTFLIKVRDDYLEADTTHEWCADGIESQMHNCQNIPIAGHPLMDRFMMRENCVIEDVSEMDDDDPFKPFLQNQDILSTLIVPMFFGENLTGFLGFDAVRSRRHWIDEDSLTLQTIADIIVNAFQRKVMETERQRLEEQLQIRQRMDSLGTLAGGIAHDFSNLLVGIMGNIELLRLDRENLTAKHAEFVDDAFSSCRHAAGLVREMQNLSKSSVTEMGSVDIHAVVSDVMNMLNRAGDKLISKKILFPPGKYHVYGNEGQLHQVFLNLGTNALQAIEDRGVGETDSITINARDYIVEPGDRTDLPPGKYVHLFFRDTGIGMSENVRRQAFDPMFTTRRSSQKGQGLGLAMVYNIVSRNHCGFIDIESNPARGTTIHIYLPLVSAGCRASAPMPEITRGTETILVVDDERTVRKFVKDSLSMLGYKVLTAVDGKRGCDVFSKRHHNIDLVILDLTTPRMSGEKALEYMRTIDPEARVIISTGHGSERLDSIKMASGVLPKPYEISMLAYTIRKVLDEGTPRLKSTKES